MVRSEEIQRGLRPGEHGTRRTERGSRTSRVAWIAVALAAVALGFSLGRHFPVPPAGGATSTVDEHEPLAEKTLEKIKNLTPLSYERVALDRGGSETRRDEIARQANRGATDDNR